MQVGESEKISKLVADTVLMLCKNSVHFSTELKVKGLIGVTSDATNIFLVEISEIFECADDTAVNPAASDAPEKVPVRRKLAMTTMSPPRKMMALMAPPAGGSLSCTKQAQVQPLGAMPQHFTQQELALIRSSPLKGASQTGSTAMMSQPRMLRPILALPAPNQANPRSTAVMQHKPVAARMQMPNSSFRGRAPGAAVRGQAVRNPGAAVRGQAVRNPGVAVHGQAVRNPGAAVRGQAVRYPGAAGRGRAVRKPSVTFLTGRQIQGVPVPRQALANRVRMRGGVALRATGVRNMRQVQPVKRVVKKMNPRLAPGTLGSPIVMPSPQSVASSALIKRGVPQSPGNQRPMSGMQRMRNDVSGFQGQSPMMLTNLQSPRMVNQMSSGQAIQKLDGRMQIAIPQSPRHSQSLALLSPRVGNPLQSPLTPTQRMEGHGRMQLATMPSPMYSQSLALPSPKRGNLLQSPLTTTQRMEGHGQMQLATVPSPRMPPVCLHSGMVPSHRLKIPLFVSSSTPALIQPTPLSETGNQESSSVVLSPKNVFVICPSQVHSATTSNQFGAHPLSLQRPGTCSSDSGTSYMNSCKSLRTPALQNSSAIGINQSEAVSSPIAGNQSMSILAKFVSTSTQANTENLQMHGATRPTQILASQTRMACTQVPTSNNGGSDLQTGTLLSIGGQTGSVSIGGNLQPAGATNPLTPGITLPHPSVALSTSGHMMSPYKLQDGRVQNFVLPGAFASAQTLGNQSNQQTVSMASVAQQSASATPRVTDAQAEGSRFQQFLIASSSSPKVANHAVKVEVDAAGQLIQEIVSSPTWMPSQQVALGQHQSLGQQPQQGQNQQVTQHQSQLGSHSRQTQQETNSPLQPQQRTLGPIQSQQVRYGQQQQMSAPGQQLQMSPRGQLRPQSVTHQTQPQFHHPPGNSLPVVIPITQTRFANLATSQGQQELQASITLGHSRPSFQQLSYTNNIRAQSQLNCQPTITVQHAPQTQSYLQQNHTGQQMQTALQSQNLQPATQGLHKVQSVAQSQQQQHPVAAQQASLMSKDELICFLRSQQVMQNQPASPYKPVMQNQRNNQPQSSLEPQPAYRGLHLDLTGPPSSQSVSTTKTLNMSYEQEESQSHDQILLPVPVAVVSADKIFQPAQSLLCGQASVAQTGKWTVVISSPPVSSEMPKIQPTETSVPNLPPDLNQPSNSHVATLNQSNSQQPTAQNLKTFIQNILENQPDRLSFQLESQLSQSSNDDVYVPPGNRQESSSASHLPASVSYESSVCHSNWNTPVKKKNDNETLCHSGRDRGSWDRSDEFDLDAFAFSQVQKLVELKQMEKSAEVASSTSFGQLERTLKPSGNQLENAANSQTSQSKLKIPVKEVPTTSFVDMVDFSYLHKTVAAGCSAVAEGLGDRGSLEDSSISPSETIAYSEGGSPLRLDESELDDIEQNLTDYADSLTLFSNERVSYFHCLFVGCRFTVKNETDLARHYIDAHTNDITLEPIDADSGYRPLLDSAHSSSVAQLTPAIPCPFPGCLRTFSKISGVTNHHQKTHKTSLTKKQKTTLSLKFGLVYRCQVCRRNFFTKSDLLHHMTKTQHGK